jgi:RNA polymerase primary sigma factor
MRNKLKNSQDYIKNDYSDGKILQKEYLKEILVELSPREQKILKYRYGFGEYNQHTLEGVGQQFSITREKVRQGDGRALSEIC